MTPAFGRICGVRKLFADRKGHPMVALETVDYELQAGRLVALLGPSGCGKTTLLRIVAGLSAASSGYVEVNGRRVDGPAADVGMVFQSPNLLPWRTVRGNVLFPMEILGRSGAAAKRRAAELLGSVGLAAFVDSRPATLSGGMKQRAALCRALIHEPALLLMDEPFGALDELTRMEMHDLLLRIRRESQATVMFVTHSISEAVYLADEILVFSARPGRVSDAIAVDLPYPRHAALRYTAAFTRLERRAGAALGVVRADGETGA